MNFELHLFHIPPSFYSQVARLALVEAGLSWRDHWILAGPPGNENYTRDYMRLNPNGTVPSLIINGPKGQQILIQSMEIVEWAGAIAGRDTLSVDPESEAEIWLRRYQGLPVRVLSYGKLGRLARFVNRRRLAALRRQLTKVQDPEMRGHYINKINDIEGFVAAHSNVQHVALEREKLSQYLDELDTHLARFPYIGGAEYCLADLVWTVTIARLKMLRYDPLASREHLSRWYEKMKTRPAFEAADIWDHPKPQKALPILLRKFCWQIALMLLGLLALTILLRALF